MVTNNMNSIDVCCPATDDVALTANKHDKHSL